MACMATTTHDPASSCMEGAFSPASYQALADTLTALVRRFTRNALQADEVVHDAISKAWQDGVAEQELAPWVMTVARNLIFTMYRDEVRRQRLRPLRNPGIAFTSTVEFELGLEEVRRLLSEADRLVFAMVLAGYATHEIALERGISDRGVCKAKLRIRVVCASCGILPGEFRFEALGSDGDGEREP